ncbi:uncharacterized protein LACBIDRAFT_321655 [Laccaria bicolor S238N-H82]|uniref:Predicted protein n=1 Tax=Laccaria bicolor (strain S238N-H82 / ATCC MYA-4686) TaxID=486041 RepID=B0CTP6_LACBS|nr:uncharacterized protein LACBIDRAFT_321655 [Laccaria bicolor S238N-H82]EDR13955.1 predicted protein [Laccaria bicolor S238N-H82]|eukprot:XP_001874514.1 predicted protein [Laccaria bicolor S238N-H82]
MRKKACESPDRQRHKCKCKSYRGVPANLLTENRRFKVMQKEPSPAKSGSICEPTVSLSALKQISARLPWLVSEVTCPCWLAVTLGLLATALLVYGTGMASPQVEAMDVDQDVDSMDVDDPPLNSNSNDEGEQSLPFPVMAKASPDLCCKNGAKVFAIPHSGNMKTMRERLAKFSGDSDAWDRTIPRARRAHLNTRYGAVSKPTKTKKRSTKHAEEMFSRSPMATPITHLLPTETESGQSKQMACEREQLLSWAKKIVESHPYFPLAARKLAAEKALAKRMAGGDLALQENLKLTNAHIEELNHRLSHMSAGMASDCITISLTATPPSAPPLPSEHITAPNKQPVQPHPATSAAQISTSAATPSSALTCTIILGDGTELTFTEADVGSPPLTGFADNVAGLNRMWDDTTPNWGGTSVLEIKGHPIPIVYWKDVYMNYNRGSPWKPRQWHGMKSKWFNWKVVVHRYCQGTHTQFWDEFSHNGERLCFTKIVQQLSELRKDEDQATAEHARAEYAANFPSFFLYKKNWVSHIKTKPSDIAKTYRLLKGISGVESDGED